ncbi:MULTISPECIES: glycosyltransferase [Pseudofrankia]|uniref:glycosyltransferase n=1 Tax=Pseudofrankia TaxID=2994363 RepID=UPI000234B987|nr:MULTISPECIES: glycosyltransferase [Pseudofrankia]OHV35987.1 glycosyl transferase [Pseudofrankia sp. EUN1h]
MARFLFATVPAVGHTAPALPIARELVARGHSVRWYTGVASADRIAATGATFHPITNPEHDYSERGLDGHYPRRRELSGIRKLRFDLTEVFAAPVAGQVRDLMALLDEEPADVLVGDTAFIGGTLVQDLGGPPLAGFGISVLAFPSRDLAPFGFGLRPVGGPVGRVRNRAMDAAMRNLLFRPMTTEVNKARQIFGLRPTRDSVFDFPRATRLYLQFSPPGFEYPVPDIPGQVRFVGPPRPRPDLTWRPPSWWDDLAGGRRVVLVNQGTVATDLDQLIRPAISALAGEEDLLVVAVTGGPDPAVLGPLPANTRVERFIPFDNLMPHVDVFVTNGGYGGVQLALAHGVPIVGAGKTEDKIEVNARVAYSGVGVDLRTQTPGAERVRAAVRQVLGDPAFTTTARRLRAEIEACGREQRAAELLEYLAAHGVPEPRRASTAPLARL